MDLTARSLAAVMSESIGQQVVVENRTGAGGLVGTDYVARAAPDGYTLLMYADANAIAPAIYKKLNHDPVKDFAPITNTILGTHLIVGHPSVAANTLKELIDLAKKGGSASSPSAPPEPARRSTSPASSSSSRPASSISRTFLTAAAAS